MERNSLASAFKSNQSYIYYHFNLQLDTFVIFSLFHIEIEGKCGWTIGGGGGGGAKGMLPPSHINGGGGGGWPPAPSLFLCL